MSAPDTVWFTKVGRNVVPNSERRLDDDVEYIRADLPDTENDALRAKLAKLEAAIVRQAGATSTLRKLERAEVQHLRDANRSEYTAANAILTDENEAQRAEIARLRDALILAKRMIDEALPKFDWGKSYLDANAITLLNEAPVAVNAALEAQP